MSRVRMIAGTINGLKDSLLDGAEVERCGIGYAHYDAKAEAWVLRDIAAVDDTAYASHDAVSASLKPEVLVAVANRSRTERLSPIFIHTHPFARGLPQFSDVDDAGEAEIAAYLERRAPDANALALVLGPEGISARRLGNGEPIAIWEIGTTLTSLTETGLAGDSSDRHDRQLRAFGTAGQAVIGRLRLLVVGAGGTGSVAMQQLGHLGAQHVTVIDPDMVEATNLNRLVGATAADIGIAKVDVAKRQLLALNPEAQVRAVVGDIVDAEHAAMIAEHDFVFLCTDSHASRAVVGQAAYQHLVPAIDMGVSLSVTDGRVTHITGRVQLLAPGQPCLSCTGALDGEQIRREMLTPEQRMADPYIVGGHVPQPAVISINSTMASLAVTMFLGVVTPIPAAARFQYYDGLRGVVRPMTAAVRETCVVCSGDGALARGSSWSLPVRTRDHR